MDWEAWLDAAEAWVAAVTADPVAADLEPPPTAAGPLPLGLAPRARRLSAVMAVAEARLEEQRSEAGRSMAALSRQRVLEAPPARFIDRPL